MNQICGIFGISRQGYYKGISKKVNRKLKEELLLQLVHSYRRKMPKIGGKKLFKLIYPDLKRMEIKLGRDKFFRILSRNGLLVQRKRRYTITTNSFHKFKIHKNLIIGILPNHRDRIYVSDITYIRIEGSFCYLALITDLYSRKIVGYDISDSLGIEGSIRALRMAIKGKGDLTGLIHHSDRGIQYCCKEYIKILTSNGIQISMAEKGNPYENAVAERLNGILKEEFMLGETFATKEQAFKAVKEAIKTYNECRPHMSINYMTPSEKYAA